MIVLGLPEARSSKAKGRGTVEWNGRCPFAFLGLQKEQHAQGCAQKLHTKTMGCSTVEWKGHRPLAFLGLQEIQHTQLFAQGNAYTQTQAQMQCWPDSI
jgi:hypothetical protein